MARNFCDARILLLAAAAAFIFIQMRLFATQSEYADRLAAAEPVAAVVIMACNRPDYLERTVQSILKYHNPVASKFPLFISQACSIHLQVEPVKTERPGEIIAYYKIANHYKWALEQLFGKYNFSHTDDMEIAPDFFDYFEAAAKLLENDKTIMAVSSWNDNGQRQFGSSMGQFFRQYLEPIKLNDVHVDWKSMDLSYLLEENFLKHFSSLVSNATLVQGTNVVLKAYNIDGDVRIQYKDQGEFEQIARQFGIFEEWKAIVLILYMNFTSQALFQILHKY
ncbi:Alpha-1-3-mannosyl-glycoprotein 2-beta-N-acetylglucosaminyltransferase [Nymphaea thermarum]|nr:Alpha-1-3-mannosyl-glycoprotein 2-beta-N-acetylglucosaminyltransferase [Nymphaea thermarum]